MKYEFTESDLILIEHKDLILSRSGIEIRKTLLHPGAEISERLKEAYPWITQLKQTFFSNFLFLGETLDNAKRLAKIAQYLDGIIPIVYKEIKEFRIVHADSPRDAYEDIRALTLPWYSQINPKITIAVSSGIYQQIADFLHEEIITAEDLCKIYGETRFFKLNHNRFDIFVINGYAFFLDK